VAPYKRSLGKVSEFSIFLTWPAILDIFSQWLLILEITGEKADAISSFHATCSHCILWIKGHLILMI